MSHFQNNSINIYLKRFKQSFLLKPKTINARIYVESAAFEKFSLFHILAPTFRIYLAKLCSH